MEFEHFALNVTNPTTIANWYVENLAMKIVFEQKEKPFMTFLADKTGRVVVELYNNSAAKVPNYQQKHHLEFHFAFKTENAEELKNKLLSKKCVLVEEVKPNDGSHLVMLRDPWGLALQLCQRATSLV